MTTTLKSLFFHPPIAVARLGASNVPLDAFHWAAAEDPHVKTKTVLAPAWSLDVQGDGGVVPRMPQALVFRDGELIRPLAPFFELWARIGKSESAASSWKEVPVTRALLAEHGLALGDLLFTVTAVNAKAARRSGRAAHRFGTFPPAEVRGDHHAPVALQGVSPEHAEPPMVPRNRAIPLGKIQVIRPRVQPAQGKAPWARDVRVDVVRLRFTPAPGHFYGPPSAATPRRTNNGLYCPVAAAHAFLDPRAGWHDTTDLGRVEPSDTYDGADSSDTRARSLGIVDDTCEARIEVRVRGQKGLKAAANVFVAPPDFAPDRRPFLSLADELNDRGSETAARNAAMSSTERDLWVTDLFERIEDVVSLFNVDAYRVDRAAPLDPGQLGKALAGDRLPNPTDAFGSRDKLRTVALARSSADELLPISERARARHAQLADFTQLTAFVRQTPGRLKAMIRPPFTLEANENTVVTTMRMPPFMRNSNSYPLTLAPWQYELLMAWADALGVPAVTPPPPMRTLSAAAARRRREVLRRIKDAP